MIKAVAELESISPLSFSRQLSPQGGGKVPEERRRDKESDADYEQRVWPLKSHFDENGIVFIPPMMCKMALAECAKFLGEKIPGRGKSTWTKHFEAGVLCMEPAPLGMKYTDLKGETFSMNADGKRGSGRRVARTFPVIPNWEAKFNFYILDSTITQKVFRHHLEEAGKFIGFGRFRPRVGGFYGRFSVKSLTWEEQD